MIGNQLYTISTGRKQLMTDAITKIEDQTRICIREKRANCR
jgi:hypothetical protein